MNFVREFNEKYLPSIVQEKREDDFIKLRQGTLSVSEYETQFTKLSKFAPRINSYGAKEGKEVCTGTKCGIIGGLGGSTN